MTLLTEVELYWNKVKQCGMEDSYKFGTWKHQFVEGWLMRIFCSLPRIQFCCMDVHHNFIYLVIKDCHARVLHNDGVKEALNEL